MPEIEVEFFHDCILVGQAKMSIEAPINDIRSKAITEGMKLLPQGWVIYPKIWLSTPHHTPYFLHHRRDEEGHVVPYRITFKVVPEGDVVGVEGFERDFRGVKGGEL